MLPKECGGTQFKLTRSEGTVLSPLSFSLRSFFDFFPFSPLVVEEGVASGEAGSLSEVDLEGVSSSSEHHMSIACGHMTTITRHMPTLICTHICSSTRNKDHNRNNTTLLYLCACSLANYITRTSKVLFRMCKTTIFWSMGFK